MVARVTFEFSIRADSTVSLEEMRQRVERALGCQFRVKDFRGTPARAADFLGMRAYLYKWRGIANRPIFQFHGRLRDVHFLDAPEGEGSVELIVQNLDRGIIDLLEVYGAGRWHIPSEAEIEAELAYGDALDRDMSSPPPDQRN